MTEKDKTITEFVPSEEETLEEFMTPHGKIVSGHLWPELPQNFSVKKKTREAIHRQAYWEGYCQAVVDASPVIASKEDFEKLRSFAQHGALRDWMREMWSWYLRHLKFSSQQEPEFPFRVYAEAPVFKWRD